MFITTESGKSALALAIMTVAGMATMPTPALAQHHHAPQQPATQQASQPATQSKDPQQQPPQRPTEKTFGFGSDATLEELSRFTSPLPDGRGLPKGSGTVMQGEKIYNQHCIACHGAKLEGGIGDRLIGGRGTLVNNDPTKAPVKTVESYWPYATTLFDYIKRSMPFTTPGILTDDEVYAVSAYILSKGGVIPEDATLDQTSLAKVEMPNRNGFIPAGR